MKNIMEYKDYYGSVNYDPDEPIFYGKVEFIKALISYEAEDAIGIKKAFEEAVDDYLELCAERKVEPEVPFKGSFNVRTGQELHREAVLAAKLVNKTLNKFICDIVKKACKGIIKARG
jgi:predicted HicB family RNase H-like nuclease